MPEGSFASLDFMFHPRSVAVPGASTKDGPGSFIAAMKEMGFKGDLYPVNPKAEEIQGLKCYPTLTAIPGHVDHVISSVPLRFVEGLMEECIAKGVKTVHFFTAGFSETGDEDAAALEARVLKRAKEAGIRVIGPNCMGLYYPAGGLSFMPFLPTEPGPVAMLSQSGANAGEFCRTAAVRGLRYSKVVSYGNGTDVRESELLEYCAEDPETDVIACYIEGITDGAHFMRALKKAAAAKPVVILKGGRTEAGSRATASHTGSLAGSLQVFDSAVRQAGATRVDRMEELVDQAVAFRYITSLTGPRAGIVGGGGGYSVLASDEIGAAGLEMPTLPPTSSRNSTTSPRRPAPASATPSTQALAGAPTASSPCSTPSALSASRRTSTTSSITPATPGAPCAPRAPASSRSPARPPTSSARSRKRAVSRSSASPASPRPSSAWLARSPSRSASPPPASPSSTASRPPPSPSSASSPASPPAPNPPPHPRPARTHTTRSQRIAPQICPSA